MQRAAAEAAEDWGIGRAQGTAPRAALRRLAVYPRRELRILLPIAALGIGSSFLTVLQPWPLKILVDHGLAGGRPPGWLSAGLAFASIEPTAAVLVVVAGLASLLLFLLNAATDTALAWGWAVAGQRLVFDLSTDLFQHLQRLSLLFHGRRSVGDSLSRLTGDSWCIYEITEKILVAPARHLTTLIGMGVAAWLLDPLLTLLALAVAPLMAGSAVILGPRIKRRSREDREARSRLLSFVQQTLSAVPLVQAFATERRNRERFERLSGDVVALTQRGVLMKSGFEIWNGSVAAAGTAAVLAVGGTRVLAGELSLGGLLVVLAYLQPMQKAFQALFGIYGTWKSVEPSAERVLEVMATEDRVVDAVDARPYRAGAAGVRIHFDRVTAGYEPGRPVLEGIELDVEPGECVALVGVTGAGKTTLAALVPRFLDPWEGSVRFDGADVRDFQLVSLRAHVSVVLQEPFLLPLSVAENVSYGRAGASRQQVVAAVRAANAEDFVEALPDGYDTLLGERGATLSGGQRQRLAIARALLKDAPVLVLDEPTSALDAETEAHVLEALDRLRRGRTTLLIAHRLATVQVADRIAVLEGGRIVETGSHGELLARGGRYRLFHRLQSADPGGELP